MSTNRSTQSQKMATGLPGLDYITAGGLFHERTTLIAGSSGSGKTLFSSNIIYRRMIDYGDAVVFVTMEETVEDIIANAKSLQWDFARLVEQGKLIFIDASLSLTSTKEVGPVNLDGLMIQISAAVQQSGATLVVLDSIGSLFSQFSDSSNIRLDIAKITHRLKQMKVTALMTAERLNEYGPISKYGVEEFVSDSVIVLRNVLENERMRRTIQVLKMRGSAHESGEFTFTISENGFNLKPLSARELKQSSFSVRVSSGNALLDEMTHGGLFRDAIILASGPTGGGKTLLGTTFTAEGCRNGERVLMLAYEESVPQLLRNAQAWGLDFEEWQKSG